MRQALQNRKVDIRTKVLEGQAKPVAKKYTPRKDVLKDLTEKYPLLKDLQNILGLRAE